MDTWGSALCIRPHQLHIQSNKKSHSTTTGSGISAGHSFGWGGITVASYTSELISEILYYQNHVL